MAENHNNNADEEKRQDQQDDNSKNEDNGKGKGKGEGETRKRPGKKPLIILGIVVVIMVIGAIIWWFMTRNLETTDDAFIEGDAVTVAPKVAGYVTELRVKDNQRVKKGDLLVVIDPRDATAQRDQAQAQLSLAESQLHQAQAQLALAKVQYPAQRDQAKAQVLRAQAELATPAPNISASAVLTRAPPRNKTSTLPTPNCAAPKRALLTRRRSWKWPSRCNCKFVSRKPMSKRARARWNRPVRS